METVLPEKLLRRRRIAKGPHLMVFEHTARETTNGGAGLAPPLVCEQVKNFGWVYLYQPYQSAN